MAEKVISCVKNTQKNLKVSIIGIIFAALKLRNN